MISIALQGQVALVTGASRGLGRGIAEGLARNGATVYINFIPEEECNANTLIEQLTTCGYDVRPFAADVADESKVCTMIETISKRHGRLDVLVNNAGIHQHLNTWEMSFNDWKKVIDINLHGTYLCSREAIKTMRMTGYGRIILISSMDAFSGTDHESHYASSKAGQIGFMRSLALEVARNNITVNAIAPGNILTPMLQPMTKEREKNLQKKIPVGRLGKVDDVVNTALFLADADSSFITGTVIHVNGGFWIG